MSIIEELRIKHNVRSRESFDASRLVLPGWIRDKVTWFLARTGISFQDFAGRSRASRLVRARELCAYLLRHWPGPSGIVPSFPEIARAMGRPNHSTAITAYQRITKSGYQGNRYPGRHSYWVRNDLDSVKPAALVQEAMQWEIKKSDTRDNQEMRGTNGA